MMRTRWLMAVVAVGIAGCGDPSTPAGSTDRERERPSPSTSGTDPLARSIDRCADVAAITTDVLSEGGSVGGLDPIFHGVLLTYARDHADAFGGLWIDREAFGTVMLAFTDDPEVHRAAVGGRRPSADDVRAVEPPPAITDGRPIGEWGVPFDVVQVAHTEAALDGAIGPVLGAVQSVVADASGTGIDVRRNRVNIDLSTPMTVEALAHITNEISALDGIGIDMVCWSGQLVDDAHASIEPGTPLDVIVLPDADGSYPPDTAVVCGGIGFELGDLDDVTPAADVEPGLRSVLDGWLGNPEGQHWPQDDWFLLREDGERATFVHIGDHGLMSVSVELGANGWIWSGAAGDGDCDVRWVLPDGMGAVEWELDPAVPAPDATATELHVRATEVACASGNEMGDRVLGPQVVETDDAVRIAFAVIAQPGGQTCPSNPSTPVVIRLDAPLGDRDLLDGLTIAPITALLAG